MTPGASVSANGRGRRSLLVVVGVLMSTILTLSLASMVSALLIADLAQGMAAAVNQAGTLRMQSYRIGLAMRGALAAGENGAAAVTDLADEFGQRLVDPRLVDALPTVASDPVRLAYTRIQRLWVEELFPALQRGAGQEYLHRVDGFVEEIDDLVRLLERRTEHRIRLLSVIETVALLATVVAALFAMVLLRRRVLRPLQVLLHAAEQARAGNFSTRTPYVGSDELGRLGTAMNLMSQDLSELYGELETRVHDKTRDLERSNRSLRLLYRSAQSLDGAGLSQAGLLAVLAELRSDLGLRSVRLCLGGDWDDLGASAEAADSQSAAAEGVDLRLGADPDAEPCPQPGAARGAGRSTADATAAAPPAAFFIADQHARYGTLWVVPENAQGLAGWQEPVLQSWTKQLATALNLRERLRESRRLVVHEERSILARELHDSLAQSLSYLKIQAMRLEQALASARQAGPPGPAAAAPGAAAEVVVADLRAGINSAYRQLRELLTSFRLNIDGQGLRSALQSAIADCRAQSGLTIDCDDRLAAGLLSPPQELHVLQIVREALSNVRRHAQATRVRVSLREQDGSIEVEVADDGVGLGEVDEPWTHHGLSIMRERAGSLGGELHVAANAAGGTCVRLRFPVRSVDSGAAGGAVETGETE